MLAISAEEAGSRLTLSRNQGVHTALLETQLRGSQYSPQPHGLGTALGPPEFLILCGVNTQVTGYFSSLVDLDRWTTDTPYTPSLNPNRPQLSGLVHLLSPFPSTGRLDSH